MAAIINSTPFREAKPVSAKQCNPFTARAANRAADVPTIKMNIRDLRGPIMAMMGISTTDRKEQIRHADGQPIIGGGPAPIFPKGPERGVK